MYNHRMHNPSKKTPPQIPPNQKTTLPFPRLPIGLSISPQKFYQIYCPQLEDIPELEIDEENWDNGQFDDAELLYNHNSTEERNRIRREYSAYFEKVKDQE